MLKEFTDSGSLLVCKARMLVIKMRIKRGEKLTADQEKFMRLFLLGPGRRHFKNDKHRDQLFDKWFKEAEILEKKLKDEEDK